MNNENMHEREIQKQLLQYLSNPADVYKTVSGRRLQILSPGKINKFEGPDYKNIAIMLDGNIGIGDAEFHRNSKDWFAHKHDNNDDYNNVLLHIVFEYNDEPSDIETLVLSEQEISNQTKQAVTYSIDLQSIEDLQHYALMRLLRKSSEIQHVLNNNTLLYTLQEATRSFLERYFSRRRRPVYTTDLLTKIIDSLEVSYIYRFLMELEEGDYAFIPDKMQMLMKSKIHSEGGALRREIILNCILPLSLCMANEEARINLLFWFWATPALNSYGTLSAKFPEMPQNFLWQQQGMLEYIKLYGNKKEKDENAVRRYGFANVLSFYSEK